MTVGRCLCALQALGRETKKYFFNKSMLPSCPRCQIVRFYTWCQIVRCQIVRGAKLSAGPNCPWCQIVRGAKLSVNMGSAKLSVMPNCPGAKLSWCQNVLGPLKMAPSLELLNTAPYVLFEPQLCSEAILCLKLIIANVFSMFSMFLNVLHKYCQRHNGPRV